MMRKTLLQLTDDDDGKTVTLTPNTDMMPGFAFPYKVKGTLVRDPDWSLKHATGFTSPLWLTDIIEVAE